MDRMIRDFVDLQEGSHLADFIDQLSDLKRLLPAGSKDPIVRSKGDDVFGRRISISYLRPRTADELAREARYSGAFSAQAA